MLVALWDFISISWLHNEFEFICQGEFSPAFLEANDPYDGRINKNGFRALRIVASILVIMMLVAIFLGGSLPFFAGLIPTPWDKLLHVIFFFLLSILLVRFVSLPVIWVVLFALLIGAADELHQLWLPGRSADWDDWLADGLGIGLGIIKFKKQPRKVG